MDLCPPPLDSFSHACAGQHPTGLFRGPSADAWAASSPILFPMHLRSLLFSDSLFRLPNSGNPLGPTWVSSTDAVSQKLSQGSKLGFLWASRICLPFLRDLCPSLSHVQCLKNHCLIYFAWCSRCLRWSISPVPAILFWLEMEVFSYFLICAFLGICVDVWV